MPKGPIITTSEAASARDEKANSFMPMLIAGLILVVMAFV